jgi:hypothetical protein
MSLYTLVQVGGFGSFVMNCDLINKKLTAIKSETYELRSWFYMIKYVFWIVILLCFQLCEVKNDINGF